MRAVVPMHSVQLTVLDLAALEQGDRALRGLDAVCASRGVFWLSGHGVGEAQVAEVLEQARRFFALPFDAKRAIERSDANPWGYFDRELTKNRRDWKEIWDF